MESSVLSTLSDEVYLSRERKHTAKLDIYKIPIRRKALDYFKAFPSLRKVSTIDDSYEYWEHEWRRCKDHAAEIATIGVLSLMVILI